MLLDEIHKSINVLGFCEYGSGQDVVSAAFAVIDRSVLLHQLQQSEEALERTVHLFEKLLTHVGCDELVVVTGLQFGINLLVAEIFMFIEEILTDAVNGLILKVFGCVA